MFEKWFQVTTETIAETSPDRGVYKFSFPQTYEFVTTTHTTL